MDEMDVMDGWLMDDPSNVIAIEFELTSRVEVSRIKLECYLHCIS